MRIFVAGATGAIGRPLIAELIRQGHTVTGMTRSAAGAQSLTHLGAAVVEVSAFDQAAVEQALRASEAEIVIDELTSLPKDPAQMATSAAGDRKLRIEGGGNLYRAAEKIGVRRYLQQASGFFLKASNGLADETDGLATDASPGVAASARAYAELEARVLNSKAMEGVALRYGFFYGPNTWYNPDGAVADQVRRQGAPVIGDGQGVWSWIHIDDAAQATVAAITAPPGIYNIVDDDPSPVSRWLPEFAQWVGAPPPPHLAEEEALRIAGEDAVYYANRLSGASNAKAKKTFNFKPRRLEWLLA
ncbi:NAD-dependent epimerase/dehydratase [Acidisarcina polymorpha]|uniref:NAD-dependent epimerase/dehydratase n=1 Tax=Acidisarcina polymorpha TaxID=2211140 RepID=A0A2Z5FVD5_9BACT|nr:NAD(P)-dependent oxidoreductase [Acidisarcina polymorpha]AXC10828.1 NAD-dependent epimerase/dehydratase [Acidisarcina polymorpha]